jgi:glycosyltransferase involved in cell wall biosynthesis
VSDFIRKQVLAWGVPAERVTTVRNTVRPFPPSRPDQRSRVRSELGIPLTAPLITMIARLDPRKGHAETLAAFERIAASHPSARLLFVGSGSIRAELEQRAHSLDCAERIIFAGFRRDVGEILAASDIFAHPSFAEPMGLAVLEATAAGLPVVAFADGGTPEAITDQENGLLAPPGDVGALTAALERLLADPAYARQLGAAGRARALREFRPEVASAQYFDVLKRVAAADREHPSYKHTLAASLAAPDRS